MSASENAAVRHSSPATDRYGPASTTKSREPAANFVTGVAMPLINLANQFAEMKIAAELLLKSKGVKIE